jgi:cbb3-type cytochrome oxidase subunit 3
MTPDSLNINLIRGVVLILLIVAFGCLWAWAWSRNRKESFHQASMLPLEEDFDQAPQSDNRKERTGE